MLAAQAAYQQMSFHEAVEAVVLLCSKGNQFLDEVKPWAALKNVRAGRRGTKPREDRKREDTNSALVC